MFSLHVPVTKIAIPRVFPALVRLASVLLMLPPLAQSTRMGAAYIVDAAARTTTNREQTLPSVHVRDFMLISCLFRLWRCCALAERASPGTSLHSNQRTR